MGIHSDGNRKGTGAGQGVIDHPETEGPGGNSVTARALTELAPALDADRCREWFFNLLRPGRAAEVCPACGVDLGERMRRTFRLLKKSRCIACGRQFQATTGTIFHRAQLTPVQVMLLAALNEVGAEPATIALAIGRGEDTARVWSGRLRGISPAALLVDPSEDPSGAPR